MLRMKFTAILGLTLVVLTSLGLLWVLGVISYRVTPKSDAPKLVSFSPDCVLDSVSAELELMSFDKALFEIYFDLPSRDNSRCKLALIQTSYEMTLDNAVGYDEYLVPSSEKKKITQGFSLFSENWQSLGETQKEIKISLEHEKFLKSISLQFAVSDSLLIDTLSEGEFDGAFIFQNLKKADDVLSFVLILHDNIRMLSRDLEATFDDPRKPNIYRYTSHQAPETNPSLPGASRFVVTKFVVEFPERERLKETLLVILSALFGVGISALLESLLASEIYSALAIGLFGSGKPEPDYGSGTQGSRFDQAKGNLSESDSETGHKSGT